MSRTIDLDKLSGIFGELASEQGTAALDTLSEGLDAFRRSLSQPVNDAELNYLASALIRQRSNDFSDATTVQRRSVSAAMNLRHGFVIKAKI